jgi:hypothetical protein
MPIWQHANTLPDWSYRCSPHFFRIDAIWCGADAAYLFTLERHKRAVRSARALFNKGTFMSGEIIFVLSDNRSGSTLLDQLLGAHPAIASLGEVHQLPAYARQDRTLYDPAHPLICTCGETVPECPFWRKVAATLGKPFDSLQFLPRFFNVKRGDGGRLRRTLRRFPRRFIEARPIRFRSRAIQWVFGGPRLAHDSFSLFDAIFAVSGSRYLVDSSKNALRFRAIRDVQPERVRAIVLGRDYRAVVHSKMKRGRSMEASAIGWRKAMVLIDALTQDLPSDRKCRLKYEALCDKPEQELRRICDFLGLSFSATMLERPTQDIHHIGGSPSKFDASRSAISLDAAYRHAFDQSTLTTLRNLVGNVADTWDY